MTEPGDIIDNDGLDAEGSSQIYIAPDGIWCLSDFGVSIARNSPSLVITGDDASKFRQSNTPQTCLIVSSNVIAWVYKTLG